MSSVHRAGLIALGFLATSAVVAACAGSDEAGTDLSPTDDAGGVDRGAPDVEGDASDAGPDANAPPRDACSSAGWCSIDVDPQLTFVDLWPLEGGSAVAISTRDGRSAVVVYEQSSWKVIYEVPFALGTIWATQTDVWVAGGEAGYVAHGRRGSANGAWTWTARSIDVPTAVSVVWGTGGHEVYAIADTRVWRLAGDGADGGDWAVDFGGDAPEADTKLVALTGTGGDDVWVTGARGTFPACGFVAHKTAGAWEMVIEGTPDPDSFWPPLCLPVGSAVPVNGPATIAAATAPGELVTIVEAFETYIAARVRHGSDGAIDVATSDLSPQLSHPRQRRSIWGASADDVYVAGFSAVRRGKDLWADGGAWSVSTVAIDGIALVKPFHVVRGTRSDDVWLAGESYVFHKTN